ncbi:MAG: hypothetical protein IKT63_01030, partial [Oscillospiraceae bacterium]|nr:hypothetical protein [Oscillospiraceae bacterium]
MYTVLIRVVFLFNIYYNDKLRLPLYVLLTPKVPKVALIAMQRPTPRCARLAIRLIVLARLRTSADTTALLNR